MPKNTRPAPTKVAAGEAVPKKNKGGRPSDFNEDIAAQLCARIAEGNSLRKVCLADDMPGTTAVFSWLGKHPEFAKQYARACEDRREVRKEQLLDIPLDADIDPQRGRLLSDNIKWVLAKEEPKKYGERQHLEHTGKDGGPIETEVLTPEDRRKRIAELAALAGYEITPK